MSLWEIQYQRLKIFLVNELLFLAKVIFSAIILSFASWLSFKKPILAGFIVSRPLVSLITILFSYAEYKDIDKTVSFAKSIFVGVPISLLFFIPFLFSKQLNLSFSQAYFSGIVILIIGYFIHKIITNLLWYKMYEFFRLIIYTFLVITVISIFFFIIMFII